MTREEKYPNTRTFRFYNHNPKNRFTEDCVFRAISLATTTPYNQVVMEMAELMCETGYAITGHKLEEAYLKKLGWVKMKQPRKADNTKYTGAEFCGQMRDNSSKFINTNIYYPNHIIAHLGGNHIVAIINNKVYDTWDSTNCCVGNYWVKPYSI